MKKILKNEPLKIAFGLVFFIPGVILGSLGFDLPSLILLICSLTVTGAGVFFDAIKGIIRVDFLDEKFLMSIASVGAFVIGESTEGAAVMLFFLVGEYFEHRAVRKSRSSIKALMDICPDTATVIIDGEETEADAEDVEVGSVIVIRSGERVPIDAVVIEGESDIDTSALTGESVPRQVGVGDTVDSGTVLIGGAIICKTLRLAEESSAARVLELVESANERKSREENFITKFSKYYTPAVIILALLMATVPPIFKLIEWQDAVYRALSFLVVSCPCALVISVPMAFFGGIGGAASRGILYKGGNTFSAISRVENIVFDKTGTLTKGEFTVSDIYPTGLSERELVCLAASAEYASNHPIAKCIKSAASEIYPASDVSEISGKGVVATVCGRRIAVGNQALMQSLGVSYTPSKDSGAVYVSDGCEYLGYITVSDTVKDEAKDAISTLYKLGMKKTYILSGDNEAAVKKVAESLGIDEYRAELLPEDKYEILESIIAGSSGSTVYVGDGINDSPCLAGADVGIAMGRAGSDSAKEAADAVIVSDNLSRIADAVKIARKTLIIAKENIVFAIGVKLLVIILVALNLSGMWMAVFADVGVAVIAILNSMRTLIQKK